MAICDKRLKPLAIALLLLAITLSVSGCGEKSFHVVGYIVDSVTGDPLGDVFVFTDQGIITQSLANGYFEIYGLTGYVNLMFFKQDWSFNGIGVAEKNASLLIKGNAIEDPPLDTYSSGGRVAQPYMGIGVSGVTVFAMRSGQTTQTDEEGFFSFSGLYGEETLFFFQDGWSFQPNPVFVTEQKGACTIHRITNASVVEQVDGGEFHSIALRSDGTVWAWGDGMQGQLGVPGRMGVAGTPLQINSLRNCIAVAAACNHSMALQGDGSAWAWGENSSGQLGDGTTANHTAPAKVGDLSNVIAIAAGGRHNAALTSDGSVWTWGENSSGQLGDGTTENRTAPVKVSGLGNVKAIACGYAHTIALKTDGTVWCWGDNEYGQLGNGLTLDSHEPVLIGGIGYNVAISAGYYHTMVLRNGGTIWVWGDNSSGQLGIGDVPSSYVPVTIDPAGYFSAIVAGDFHSLALHNNGSVYSWGKNLNGQLGNATRVSSNVPVLVEGLNYAVSIAAGSSHSFAIGYDRSLWAWGMNGKSQLGDDWSADDRLCPVLVKGNF